MDLSGWRSVEREDGLGGVLSWWVVELETGGDWRLVETGVVRL